MEKMLENFANEQFDMLNNDGEWGLISFYFEEAGVTIINPYLDEIGMFDVNPEEYYGKENFENWKKEAIARINKNK